MGIACSTRGRGDVRVHAMKEYRGIRDTAPLLRKFDARWRWMISFTLRLRKDGKEPRYQLHRMLDGSQTCYGSFSEQKNLFPLRGFEPWTVYPVAQSPYWLHYPDYEWDEYIILLGIPLEKTKCRLEDNINVVPKYVWYRGMERTYLAMDRDRWWTFLITALNGRHP